MVDMRRPVRLGAIARELFATISADSKAAFLISCTGVPMALRALTVLLRPSTRIVSDLGDKFGDAPENLWRCGWCVNVVQYTQLNAEGGGFAWSEADWWQVVDGYGAGVVWLGW